MPPKIKLKIFKDVRKALSNPKYWARGAFGLTAGGLRISCLSHKCFSRCLLGQLTFSARNQLSREATNEELTEMAENIVGKNQKGLIELNDKSSHLDILFYLDSAILSLTPR